MSVYLFTVPNQSKMYAVSSVNIYKANEVIAEQTNEFCVFDRIAQSSFMSEQKKRELSEVFGNPETLYLFDNKKRVWRKVT